MKPDDQRCPTWRVTVRRTNGYFVYLFAGTLKMLSKLDKQNRIVNREIIVNVELVNENEVMKCQ